MRDLGQRGLQALAVTVRADPELERAIRRETSLRLLEARHEGNTPGGVNARAMTGLFRVHGKADAYAPTIGFATALPLTHALEADGVHGPAQGLLIVAGIEVALGDIVERHLLGAYQAFAAQVIGFDAEPARQSIERNLQGEAHTGSGNAAIGQYRRLVGGHRIHTAAVMREVVEARKEGADLAAFQAG